MGKAADYVKDLNTSISNAIKRLEPFLATLSNRDAGNGRVQIKRIGADTPDAESYARLLGPASYVGEKVAVIELGGKPFVLGTVQTVSNEIIVFDGPVRVDSSFAAQSFNSPRIFTTTDTSPTTASTTTVDVYFQHGAVTLALPTGTWSVHLITTGGLSHTAGGQMYYQAAINGAGGQITYQDVPSGGDHLTATTVARGLSGTITLSSNYLNRAAGTARANYSTFTMIAVRTA